VEKLSEKPHRRADLLPEEIPDNIFVAAVGTFDPDHDYRRTIAKPIEGDLGAVARGNLVHELASFLIRRVTVVWFQHTDIVLKHHRWVLKSDRYFPAERAPLDVG
jgi:hypothetical protein